MYAFSDTRSTGVLKLIVVGTEGKRVWVNDGSIMYKLNISYVLPQKKEDDDHSDVLTLLKSLIPYKTNENTVICIAEVLAVNHQERGRQYLNRPNIN